MVGMLDYHLHYALMATEDRVRDVMASRRGSKPMRPHRRPRLLRERTGERP